MDDPVASGSPATNSGVIPVIDSRNIARTYEQFLNYLRKTVPAILPEHDVNSPALSNAFSERANSDVIQKFVCDPQVYTLYIQRFSIKGMCDNLLFDD